MKNRSSGAQQQQRKGLPNVSSGLGKAINEPSSHRIAERDHDDRDGAGCVLCRPSGRGGAYSDNVCLATHTFGSECWKPLATTLCGKVVDVDALPIHITQIAQALEERKSRRLQRTWIERKEAETWDFLGLLRTHSHRPRSRCAPEERDEVAAVHSMTSSARASSIGGISMPSALAVFRLISNSYFEACSTGRSAGLAPFRILSM